jgi:hypothetical protein
LASKGLDYLSRSAQSSQRKVLIAYLAPLGYAITLRAIEHGKNIQGKNEQTHFSLKGFFPWNGNQSFRSYFTQWPMPAISLAGL